MIYLTILNTLAIVYLIFGTKIKYYLRFTKELSSCNKTLLGYRLILWKKTSEFGAEGKGLVYLKIRDRNKTEKQEDANRMIAKYSQQNKLQALTAMFSWLKTWDEVREFQKYYTCVDKNIVDNLVSKFVPKSE